MRTTRYLIPAIALAVVLGSSANAADGIKGGNWEFSSQMQMPAMPQLPPGVQLPAGVQLGPGGGMNVKHTQCVDPAKAVPTDPRGNCKIERMQNNAGTVSWATSCTTAQGVVHSEGAARYSGDTMEANVTVQAPQQGGHVINTTQHITGRYLGPCTPR